ncbi:MAG: RecX family transcriptional regulator [Dehalococcoidales bacterium]|nr:RecX family transcriptional regulator [Dehalococcoidales bacterium]MDP6448891.1 RecX family transcriptional regulator [Dehalococcoidales bacterium]MDP6576959.1 RecX family transcriptional regulator [Dehalococcoidales bacterium]MDP6825165.1 RecX family transcriptional regulator [Dehalococcoidales bacterium]
MKRITALRRGRGRGKRMNIFLDGRFAYSLGAELTVKEDLRIGQELPDDYIETLEKSDRFQRCFDSALRYLSYRPRSESEIREKLRRHGGGNECVAEVITRLKEQGLVDDIAFARFWKDNRETFNPRSQQLTRLELRQKGVDSGIINQVITEDDDTDNAYRSALSKIRHWPPSDYQSFRRRLGEYLRRRGFNYEVINSTVARLWQERENRQGEDSTLY